MSLSRFIILWSWIMCILQIKQVILNWFTRDDTTHCNYIQNLSAKWLISSGNSCLFHVVSYRLKRKTLKKSFLKMLRKKMFFTSITTKPKWNIMTQFLNEKVLNEKPACPWKAMASLCIIDRISSNLNWVVRRVESLWKSY